MFSVTRQNLIRTRKAPMFVEKGTSCKEDNLYLTTNYTTIYNNI